MTEEEKTNTVTTEAGTRKVRERTGNKDSKEQRKTGKKRSEGYRRPYRKREKTMGGERVEGGVAEVERKTKKKIKHKLQQKDKATRNTKHI